MLDRLRKGRWLVAASLVAASCAQGDRPKLTGPTGSTTAANNEGTVGILAEGDVKVGNGSLAIERLRMDRQNAAGASVLRQYANPGGEYRMEAGETIELWAEWNAAGVPRSPRLIVDWGDGASDFTGCGRCLLTHTYPNPGRYIVKVTLDDLTGTTITRTFVLNSLDASCAPPTVRFIPNSLSCSAISAGAFFGGTNLTYSLQDGVCAKSQEVAALRVCSVAIDPATGVITGDLGCTTYCKKVTATNACGTVTSNVFLFGCT